MFVVTVEFEVEPERAEQFRVAVVAQARNSLELESECTRFDVSVDADDSARFFLYELYTDEAAFRSHLDTPHYFRFDETVSAWVVTKTVRSWSLVAETSDSSG